MEVAALLARIGDAFAVFEQQDSGCTAYGIGVDGQRWFVKVSREQRAIPSLLRAIEFHRAVAHPAIIALADSCRTHDGVALVYPWVDGEVLYGAPMGGRAKRLDPTGPHARFRALPVPDVLAAIDDVFAAHVAVVDAGFVAVDLYDGCFIYDFAKRRMMLCDLDEYRRGPFTVEGDRLPGSTRFMAPEELERGGVIDERTTAFDLGRAALVLLDEGDMDGRFRGTEAMAAVLERATRRDRSQRYASVRELVEQWRRAVDASMR
jgi:hypothetical protein